MAGNAPEVARATVTIIPSMEGAQKTISDELGAAADSAGGSAGKRAGSSFSSALKGGLATAGAAVAAVGTAAVAGGKALVSAAGDVASYGDEIDKQSQKLGLSAEAYQEWDFVLQHSGTSIDSLKGGMKVLNNTMADAGSVINETLAAEAALDDQLEAGTISLDEYNAQYEDLYAGAYDSLGPLTDLGFSMAEIHEMSQDSDLALAKVVTALQGMPEGAERAALAQDLLGRSAQEMGALLNTSAEDTANMIQQAHDLGGVMGDEAVKSSAAFQDSLQNMTTSLSGLKNNMMSEFLPSLTTIMDGITGIVSGDTDGGLGMITEGIKGFVDNLMTILPQMLEVGVGIIEALVQAIIDNLPLLIDTAVPLLMEIVQAIIDNLPALLEAATQIIIEIALGIAEALPELIPTIVDTIIFIVEALIDNIDLLIDAGIQLIIGLAQGLINALPRLIEKGPEIVIKLVEAIIENAPKLLEAATQLILMMIEGIVNLFGKIIETGAKIVESVKDGFSQKVQDAKNWGKDLIDNFIGGIKEKWEHLKDTIKNVAQSVKDFLGFSEPSKGPLSNFHTYAPDMMELFAKGIRDNEGVITSQLESSLDIGGAFMLEAPAAGGDMISALRGALEGLAGDMVIPIYIGQEKIDEQVVRATQRANYRSGGR